MLCALMAMPGTGHSVIVGNVTNALCVAGMVSGKSAPGRQSKQLQEQNQVEVTVAP